VKKLLKAKDTDALDEARELLARYDSTSKDDAAQRAILEAFAQFGYAALRAP